MLFIFCVIKLKLKLILIFFLQNTQVDSFGGITVSFNSVQMNQRWSWLQIYQAITDTLMDASLRDFIRRYLLSTIKKALFA